MFKTLVEDVIYRFKLLAFPHGKKSSPFGWFGVSATFTIPAPHIVADTPGWLTKPSRDPLGMVHVC